MVALRNIALLLSLVALAMSPSKGHAGPAAPKPANPSALFAQSAAAVLSREFSNPEISYLLVDARSGQTLATRWANADAAIPMGSLLKPFAALAYGEQHAFRYPSHICRGSSTGCWLPRGHGDVDLPAAIGQSCNSYFRTLTAELTAADVSPTAARFGLDSPDPETSGLEFAGMGTRWRVSPLRLAHAYLELLGVRQQPGVRQILDGMALSAQRGTGAAVHLAFPFPNTLAKTGTAACTHSRRAPGDGFTVLLVPVDEPRILLMVRVHGVPGAQAARIAGQMLRRIEE